VNGNGWAALTLFACGWATVLALTAVTWTLFDLLGKRSNQKRSKRAQRGSAESTFDPSTQVRQ